MLGEDYMWFETTWTKVIRIEPLVVVLQVLRIVSRLVISSSHSLIWLLPIVLLLSIQWAVNQPIYLLSNFLAFWSIFLCVRCLARVVLSCSSRSIINISIFHAICLIKAWSSHEVFTRCVSSSQWQLWYSRVCVICLIWWIYGAILAIGFHLRIVFEGQI